VGDEFLDLFRILEVDRVDFIKLAVDDCTTRQQQVARSVVIGLLRQVAVGQHVL